MTAPSRPDHLGFTLIELAIVVAVVFPILAGIAMTTTSVNNTMNSNSRSADVTTYSRRMVTRLAKLVRPAKMSTIKVPAVAQDVVELRASAVGQWIDPTDLIWRPGLEFRASGGTLAVNAALSTTVRRVVFVLDSGETDNDADDDGDGLVDEGRIVMVQNTITLDILKDVEEFSVALDGRILKVRLTVARLDAQRRRYRCVSERQFYIRNN